MQKKITISECGKVPKKLERKGKICYNKVG